MEQLSIEERTRNIDGILCEHNSILEIISYLQYYQRFQYDISGDRPDSFCCLFGCKDLQIYIKLLFHWKLSKKKSDGTFILNDRETDVFSWSSMIVANKLNCKLTKMRRRGNIRSTVWLEIGNESTKINKLIPDIDYFLRSKHISHICGLIENDMNIVQRKIADACVRQLNLSSSCSDSDNEFVNTHLNESTSFESRTRNQKSALQGRDTVRTQKSEHKKLIRPNTH